MMMTDVRAANRTSVISTFFGCGIRSGDEVADGPGEAFRCGRQLSTASTEALHG